MNKQTKWVWEKLTGTVWRGIFGRYVLVFETYLDDTDARKYIDYLEKIQYET